VSDRLPELGEHLALALADRVGSRDVDHQDAVAPFVRSERDAQDRLKPVGQCLLASHRPLVVLEHVAYRPHLPRLEDLPDLFDLGCAVVAGADSVDVRRVDPGPGGRRGRFVVARGDPGEPIPVRSGEAITYRLLDRRARRRLRDAVIDLADDLVRMVEPRVSSSFCCVSVRS